MNIHNTRNRNSMAWMIVLHAVPMGLLLFWNKIPTGYVWIGYVAIGIFILAHFLLASGGGGCGGHEHGKENNSVIEQ